MTFSKHASSEPRHHGRRSRRTAKPGGKVFPEAGRIDGIFENLIEAALAGSILIVPFMMGGRHPIGQVALVSLAAVAVAAWGLRQVAAGRTEWHPTWASLILGLSVVLLLVQTAPLPPGWFAKLSPHAAQMLPLWSSEADASTRLGDWNQLSLSPAETRAGLSLFLSYSLLFLVAAEQVRRVEHIERMLRWCAAAATLMALFGLIQYFAGNGKFFWFHESPYSHTFGVAKGSFTNRNHFAHLMALGIGPLIWWLHSLYRPRESDDRHRRSSRHDSSSILDTGRWLLIFAVAAVAFAGLLSQSRGGNSAILLAATIAAVACGTAATVNGRFLLGIAAVGLVLIVALNFIDFEKITNRLGDLSSGSIDQLDRGESRRTIWATTARAIPDFGLFGSGVGSFVEVCPAYLKIINEDSFCTHAENGYLQATLETGPLGSLLLLSGIGLCVFWCIRGLRAPSSRLKACFGAIAASLAASMTHSLVDFVWYVPGCMAMVAVLAGLACAGRRLAQPTSEASPVWHLSPIAAGVVALGMLVLSISMIENRVRATVAQHYWDRYRIAAIQSGRENRQWQQKNKPLDRPAEIAAERRKLNDLEQVVRWLPEHSRAHVCLARSHLRLFELLQMESVNPMPLVQVRDAAIASQSQFPSREARDEWMFRAFGEHCRHLYIALHHAKMGLRLCPLDGDAYVCLAQLCFLDGATPDTKRVFLNQAMLVRPFDGDIWSTAAWETWQACLSGDLRPWIDFAKKTLASNITWRKRQILAEPILNTPPEGVEDMVDFLISELNPDFKGFGFIYQAALSKAKPEQLAKLRRVYAAKAESEAIHPMTPPLQASMAWQIAATLHGDMGNPNEAIRCMQNAANASPGNPSPRYALACLLLKQNRADEALTHLQSCLRHQPDNKIWQKTYREAIGASTRSGTRQNTQNR